MSRSSTVKSLTARLAEELAVEEAQVAAAARLLDEGATVPFIARYRKDMTGGLDEVQILQVQDEAKFLKEFSERKTFIEKSITEQGKMTEYLQGKINSATTLVKVNAPSAARSLSEPRLGG